MEPYFHFPLRPNVVVINLAQTQNYTLLSVQFIDYVSLSNII
jgi:hypothetical protein